MKFLVALLLALLLFPQSARATNPDGPTGLLTIRASYAGVVGWGSDERLDGTPQPNFLEDWQNAALGVGIIIPVSSIVSLEAGYDRQQSDQTVLFTDGTFEGEFTQHFLSVGARFHIGLTERAREELRSYSSNSSR